MSNFEGNRGTKTLLGNREHNKTFFLFFIGNRRIPRQFFAERPTLIRRVFENNGLHEIYHKMLII